MFNFLFLLTLFRILTMWVDLSSIVRMKNKVYIMQLFWMNVLTMYKVFAYCYWNVFIAYTFPTETWHLCFVRVVSRCNNLRQCTFVEISPRRKCRYFPVRQMPNVWKKKFVIRSQLTKSISFTSLLAAIRPIKIR